MASLQGLALILALAAPIAARADARLLEEELQPPDVRMVVLRAAVDDAPRVAQAGGGSGASASPSSLDFDLLGEAKAPPVPPEDRSMRLRRRMLGIHQTAGIGLFSLQLATTVVGQLNYNDKFGDSNTGRYKLSHAALAYTTFGVFVANGALALFSPGAPSKPDRGFDRVTLHKVSMFAAAVGMATQVALGVYTSSREGYDDKQDIGRAHLIVGYATLAAITAGVSAIVF